jgi:PleD family two-component response regulator
MAERVQPTGLPLVLLAGERDTQWLERLVEAGGYAVMRERTGRHALQRAHATQPDAIIVEAELPDMTGAELCGALRKDIAVAVSTPILLCVAEAITRETRLGALRAGAWECVAPPHDADEILLKLDAFVHAKLDGDRARAEGLLDSATGLYNRQGLARRARELGSQAFRQHGALACVVLALDADPGDPTRIISAPAVARGAQALKAAARLSDVIGRLTPAEFAVLAPDTDAAGARRLAERLGPRVDAALAADPGATEPAAAGRSLPSRPPRVRCGYEAIGNVGYAPIEPVELLVRAATALRTGRAEAGDWIRRFEPFAAPPAP